MAELTDGISSHEMTKYLLTEHHMLIKDLTSKTGGKNYIRLAVRNTADNNRLMMAIKAVMAGMTTKRKNGTQDQVEKNYKGVRS